MNFDGQALVVNQYVETFYSDNGSAVVLYFPRITEFNYALGDATVKRIDVIFNNTDSMRERYIMDLTSNDFYNRTVGDTPCSYSSTYAGPRLEEIPFTAQIYTKAQTKWKGGTFPPSVVQVIDKRINHRVEMRKAKTKVYVNDRLSRYDHDFHMFKSVSANIHDIVVPDNLRIMNQATAFIVDCVTSSKIKEFPGVSANIFDKTEIIIPSVSKGYQDMFLVVQKNNFIELKLSDTIIDVIGLPDGLEYSLNSIKGVILKSGSYDITIQYQENTQKLNIIVPYYERTL